MKRFVIASCGLAMVVALVVNVAQARTWTDTKGRTIEAEYVGMQDGAVQLRTRDGKVHTLPAGMLSGEDQMMLGDDRFSAAIRSNPQDADAYFKRAMARNNREQHEAALKDFNRALKLNPRHAEAYDGRGTTLAKTGEVVKAQKDFDRAIEIDPKFSSAYRHRADNYKAMAKTPEGRRVVDQRTEVYRQSHSAAKIQQLRDKGWQPLNATTGNISRYAGMSLLARADYDLAARIEAGYDIDGGYGVGGGGVGIGVGGPGVAVKGYPGVGVISDAPLTVYPIQVKRGDVITLVANPAAMAAGMPQKLNSEGKPIKTAYGKKGPGKMDVGSVDFYRDADGNGELDPAVDQYLASDSTMQDGYTAEVNTAIMPPGPQNFFAIPNGTEESGMSAAEVATLIEKLREAANKEKALAEQATAAAEGSGLTAEAAAEACGCQDELASLTADAYSQLQGANPEAAEALKEAGKPIKAINNLMKAAKSKPGEESKEKAASAAEKAEQAAANIEDAIAKLEQGGAEPQVAQGSPAAAKGEILPNPELAAAPAPAPGKPGPGKPGSGDDGPDVHNHYHGDGDDDADIHNHFYDDEDVDDTIDRALGYVEDGDYDRAIEDYDRVIVDDPDNVIVRRHRAGAYLARGGYDLAIRDYDVLVQQPELTVEQRADFYYNRGCAHLAAGNLAPAITDFTTSIEIDEIGRLAYMSYNNRGIAYAKQGDFNEALAQFNKAIEINDSDPLAYKNRALAYKKLGKITEAEQDTAKMNELGSL